MTTLQTCIIYKITCKATKKLIARDVRDALGRLTRPVTDIHTGSHILRVTNRKGNTVEALIDPEDWERVNANSWHQHKGKSGIYLATKVTLPSGIQTTRLLQRFLLDAQPGQKVDHHNGNTMDYRRANLRLATSAQNSQNSRKQSGRSSLYKGVCWDKRREKWVANIKANGKALYLGSFACELEASKAYDNAALVYFGEFACLNHLRTPALSVAV